MGQYHMLVNLDKREFIYSHELGDGLKAWEQFASGPGGVMSAAIYLMVAPEPRGGGDFDAGPYMGRWHGDRVTWVGDYAEKDDFDPVSYGDVTVYPDIIYALCSTDEADRLAQLGHSREVLADQSRGEVWHDAARRIIEAGEAGLWFTNITPEVREAMTPELESFMDYSTTEYGSITRKERTPEGDLRMTTAMRPDMIVGLPDAAGE
jgi:hypothetical protein